MTGPSPDFPLNVTVCSLADLPLHGEIGYSHVVSILDPGFAIPAAFERYLTHHRLDLRFHDVIDEAEEYGYNAPDRVHVERLLGFALELPSDPVPTVLIHCHMGISRSTAAAILLLATRAPDRTEADIVAEVVRVRPQAWPNLRMIEMGDSLLGREGRLVDAVRRRHRSAARANPDIVAQMRGYGRHRELEGI